MKVRLRILHGKLRDKQGRAARTEVRIGADPFVIGSDPDCSMRCQSRSVSPRHCEVVVEQGRVLIRSLCNDHGTFVNDQQVEDARILQPGDHLRVGRLEFEVLFDAAPPESRAAGDSDAYDRLLDEGDEQARAFRREHPEERFLHLPKGEEPAPAEKASGDQAEEAAQKGLKRKTKSKPGKLPPPPPEVTEDSTEAAQHALRKLFRK